MPRRTSPTSPLAALLVAGLSLGLAGCLPSAPPVTPPPTSDAEPVFASDEEALAAAEAAYGAYLATADAILRDGGEDPDRLLKHVSDTVYVEELEGFERIRSNGWHGTGATTFTLALQQYDTSYLVAYVCEDVSGTDLLDASGASVVKAGRLTLVPFEVEFDVGDLNITSKETWSGAGVC